MVSESIPPQTLWIGIEETRVVGYTYINVIKEIKTLIKEKRFFKLSA